MNGATVAGELPADVSSVDKWILSRLQHVIAEVDEQFAGYEFAKACDTLYHFAWDDVCDWYVELSKPVLAAGGTEADRTRRVLGHVLDQLLRLLHPVVPFVTEALWTALTGGESLVVAGWPQADGARLDPAAEAEVAALQDVVTEVRRFRSEQGLRPSQRVAARIGGLPATGIAAHEPLVRALTRLETPEDGFAPTASLSVRSATVELDLSGAIDVAAERARLAKDLAAAEKELRTATAKLANTDFIDKAPEAVVTKVRTRLASAESDVERITGQLAALPTP